MVSKGRASVVEIVSMGSVDGKRVTTKCDPEPGRPKRVTKPSPGQRPGDGVSIVAAVLKGRANRSS